MPASPSRSETKAIWVPSGDQAGETAGLSPGQPAHVVAIAVHDIQVAVPLPRVESNTSCSELTSVAAGP